MSEQFILGFDSRFEKSPCEPCMYFLRCKEVSIFVLVHVDDYIIAHNNDKFYDSFVAGFRKHFSINDLGDAEHVLQISIKW